MLTSELLDAHRDVLKEKESIIIGLPWKVEEFNAEGNDTTTKITQLQADLNHEAAV